MAKSNNMQTMAAFIFFPALKVIKQETPEKVQSLPGIV